MKDTQELVCGNGGCNNGEAVAKLYKIVGSNGNVFEEKGARCQRCVDKAKASEVTYTPVEAPKPESPKEDGPMTATKVKERITPSNPEYFKPETWGATGWGGKSKQTIQVDPNTAMIERDLCDSARHVDKPDDWAAAVAKALTEALQSQVISTAWNRTNRIPRIVGFDPHLPRQE